MTLFSRPGWQEAMRIDASALGGWGHVVSLNVEQSAVSAPSDRYSWPYAAGVAQPNTWAPTVLGPSVYLPLFGK